ncbi:NADPH-dependent FMN reductase [Methanococcus aeolicus Nankai-3]|jgi:multimeric flavodoxin WrbA|uniref:NADPH-dependent FMN reductase n=1 Tax=Methanococcus aeolicus (strain ATCC BAA-1280 / DSM 17508 / OCM 812 / Nankai-3) TaxID=419665 RepID=A6UTT7_META3|nr:flavodoxin family protein [Methanococcus aeolicus]ABR55909.1 NADPH-dependent FMN reductase [Methanococcus aeolicus Nankai-3]
MKIFGISGSPRLQGTNYAVNYALDYLKEKGCEIKYFSVARKEIKFCMHCDYCIRKKEGCIHKDDMNEVYENLIWADGIIMGAPVYQGNITGQLKTMMDRSRAIVAKNPKVLNGKIGMGITIGGDRNGGQEIALRTIHDFYMINEMIPVGGGSFGANLGATFWSKDKGKDGIMKDEEGLRVLRKTLNKFYNTLSKNRV